MNMTKNKNYFHDTIFYHRKKWRILFYLIILQIKCSSKYFRKQYAPLCAIDNKTHENFQQNQNIPHTLYVIHTRILLD